MRDIEYERQLDVDTRMRARYQVIRRRVSRFIVQLEVLAEGKWRPVVRYDTSHKFAHRDLYRRRGRVMKTDLKMSFEEALTHALDDLRDNWESYKEKFFRRVSMSKDFKKLNAELGAEFDRYVAEHPAWAQKHIPPGAKIALQVEGNAAFNAWSRQLAKRTRGADQRVVFVCIEKLAPVRSRIIKATVLRAA